MSEITINKYSDKTLRFEWKDSLGSPVPVENPLIVGASENISDHLSTQEVDYSNGSFNVIIEGSHPNAIPEGVYSFRVQVGIAGGDTSGSPRVTLYVV